MAQDAVTVRDNAGRVATLDVPVDNPRNDEQYVTIHLDDGRSILVARNLLIQKSDGSFYTTFSFDALGHEQSQTGQNQFGAQIERDVTLIDGPDEVVVPVVEETLTVAKRSVETGIVRVHKHVTTREEQVEQTLLRSEVEIVRVPINQVVDAPAERRQEGDTLIIPIYEEVLVVEKRLMLKEEIHLTRRETSVPWSDQVTLRREEIEIERVSPHNDLP